MNSLGRHYRIATRDDSTRIGFPEVKLGIFPGFNGTARSIKQVGPMAAMQAMLTGGTRANTIDASAFTGLATLSGGMAVEIEMVIELKP